MPPVTRSRAKACAERAVVATKTSHRDGDDVVPFQKHLSQADQALKNTIATCGVYPTNKNYRKVVWICLNMKKVMLFDKDKERFVPVDEIPKDMMTEKQASDVFAGISRIALRYGKDSAISALHKWLDNVVSTHEQQAKELKTTIVDHLNGLDYSKTAEQLRLARIPVADEVHYGSQS